MGITAPTSASDAVYRKVSASTDSWLVSLNPFFVQPGQYDFTSITGFVRNTSGVVTSAYAVIYSYSGSPGSGTFQLVGRAPITLPSVGGTPSSYSASLSGSLSLTAKAGASYYWGVAVLAHNAEIGHQKNASGPQQTFVWTAALTSVGSAFPVSLSESAADFANSNHILGKINFTTTSRTVAQLGDSTTKFFDSNPTSTSVIVPHRTDATTWIILRSAVVGIAGTHDTLTANLSYGQGTAAGRAVLDTFIARLNGTSDVIRLSSTNVNLNSSVRENGDTFDFGLLVRPVGATTHDNVYWVNRTHGQGPANDPKDIATFCHRTRATGSRTSGLDGYTPLGSAFQPVEYIDFTVDNANSSIESLIISDRLCVVFGDSNIGANPNLVATPAVPAAPQRLGAAFPVKLEHPLPWWIAGIPSNPLASGGGSATAGYLRYKSAAPGNGDICDMWNILLFFQMGGNDMKDFLVTQTDLERNQLVSRLSQRLSEILADLFVPDGNGNGNARANRAFLFSMPVFRDPGAEDVDARREIFVQWSNSVLGLACAWRVSFYDSYYDIVAHDNRANNTYLPPDNRSNNGYQQFDGVHYTDGSPALNDGAGAICTSAVLAYQTNRVGGSGLSVY